MSNAGKKDMRQPRFIACVMRSDLFAFVMVLKVSAMRNEDEIFHVKVDLKHE